MTGLSTVLLGLGCQESPSPMRGLQTRHSYPSAGGVGVCEEGAGSHTGKITSQDCAQSASCSQLHDAATSEEAFPLKLADLGYNELGGEHNIPQHTKMCVSVYSEITSKCQQNLLRIVISLSIVMVCCVLQSATNHWGNNTTKDNPQWSEDALT